MDPNGQTYFDSEDAIPEADRKRYLESLREENERLKERLEVAARNARERPEDRHQGLSDPMG